MTKAAHTPGPWNDCGHGDYGDYDGNCIVILGDDQMIRVAVVLGNDTEETRANARLIAAAPDLLKAQTMGAQVNTPDFLDWIAERLVHQYGESPNVDFVLSLRDRARAGRAAIAKAEDAQ